jgi:hypothetical protein
MKNKLKWIEGIDGSAGIHFNDIMLGYAYKEVDGFYVFVTGTRLNSNDPPKKEYGYWDAWILRGIADLLDEHNKEWNEQIQKELKTESLNKNIEDLSNTIIFDDLWEKG